MLAASIVVPMTKEKQPELPREWAGVRELASVLGVRPSTISDVLPRAEAEGNVTVIRDRNGKATNIKAAEFLAWWPTRKDRRRKE